MPRRGRSFPVWYVLVTTLIQCAIGQAGRLIAAAAVFYYLFSASMGLPVPLAGWAAILGIASVLILLRGRYAALLKPGAKIAGGLALRLGGRRVLRAARPDRRAQPLPDLRRSRGLVACDRSVSWGCCPRASMYRFRLPNGGRPSGPGWPGSADRLEEAGLAGRFNAFAPRISRTSPWMCGDSRKRAVEYSRRCFPDQPVGLQARPRGVVHHRDDLRAAVRRLALSEPRRGTGGDGRDCGDLHGERRPLDDDGVHDRRLCGDVFDRLQLLRRLAPDRRRVRPQPLSADRGSRRYRGGPAHP